jgi:hypothetical protein
MDFGVTLFHTDYSMPVVALAQACEARGFESLWAPEHSHIPLSRKTPFPGGGDLPKPYYDALDPFVRRPLPLRHWRRLEPGRDGGSRHGLRQPLQADARAD